MGLSSESAPHAGARFPAFEGEPYQRSALFGLAAPCVAAKHSVFNALPVSLDASEALTAEFVTVGRTILSRRIAESSC
ncbi:hypothetical protein OFN66_31440, partial [Escherichia coli]|nr:hypothetical protein [Escherichia coli]